MSGPRELTISTEHKRQVVDISDEIQSCVPDGSGVLHLFVQHTTAALTTADLDPGTDQDLLDALDKLLPDLEWRHPHNPAHTPDHLLASIIGPGLSMPYAGGKLALGIWQRIILVEFDGARDRKVTVA